jgi:hypothetical protein
VKFLVGNIAGKTVLLHVPLLGGKMSDGIISSGSQHPLDGVFALAVPDCLHEFVEPAKQFSVLFINFCNVHFVRRHPRNPLCHEKTSLPFAWSFD